jgi:hypothetical protein
MAILLNSALLFATFIFIAGPTAVVLTAFADSASIGNGNGNGNGFKSTTKVSAVVGGRAVLPCLGISEAPEHNCNWDYYSSQDIQSPVRICTNGGLVNGYKNNGNYSLPRTSPNNHSLVIMQVRLDESGTYVCTENSGFGARHQVTLEVAEAADVPDSSATTLPTTEQCGSKADQQVPENKPADGTIGCGSANQHMYPYIAPHQYCPCMYARRYEHCLILAIHAGTSSDCLNKSD